MIKQNLHTHSTYCDGNDTIEEMVETAIAKNFKVLGFSGHGPFENDECAIPMGKLADYIAEVKRVKEKYASKIKIYLGIEEDALGIKFNHDTFDYIIGSVHKVYDGNIYQTIDYRKDVTNKIIIDGYNGNFLEFAKSYFNEMEKLIDDPEIDIIGHFDLIQKYNENQDMIAFDNQEYLELCYRILDKIIAANKIIEVNTGAIARGYRLKPYPHELLLRYIAKNKGMICLNSDCHDRNYLDCYYDESIQLIKNCGFDSMMILDDDGFKKTAI